MAQLRTHQDNFQSKGVGIAAIGLGDAQYALEFRQETGIRFPLLIDTDRKAYAAADLKTGSLLGLVKRETFVARERAKAGGHHQHKLGKNPFQLGGSFIFGPGEVDIYAHVSQNFGDNAPMSELLSSVGSPGDR